MAERDPELPHQIIFRKNYVSCNCRRVFGKHARRVYKGDTDYYEPMPNPEKLNFKVVYNNPENHNQPFTEEDMIL